METNTIIISISSASVVVTILIAWFKYARLSRAVEIRLQLLESNYGKSTPKEHVDEQIKNLAGKFEEIYRAVDKLINDCCGYDRDIVRIQEAVKMIDMYKNKLTEIEALRSEFLEKFTRRGDFIREMQVLNSQVQATYQKVDRLEEQVLDKLRKRSD